MIRARRDWRTAFAFAFLALTGRALAADAAAVQQVQRDVEMLARAPYENKPEVMLAFTHPLIFAMLGGEARVRQQVTAGLAETQRRHFQLVEFSFPAPPTFLHGVDNEYAIVPFSIVVDTDKGRFRTQGYEVGVRANESSQWYYAGGASLNQHNVHEAFPDFPADYQFPATSSQALDPPGKPARKAKP